MVSLLQNPIIFNTFQDFLRVRQVRTYFVEHYVKPKSGMRVLDIGCGTGELRPYFEGCDYLGFDFDERYIEQAKNRFGADAFLQGDVSVMNAQAESFDIAIAAGVLHHLDDAQAKALFDLAWKALKPGGRLCSFDMCDRGPGFFPRLMNRLDRGKFIRTEMNYTGLARERFPQVHAFDYCGELLIPVHHCVMVCTKPERENG